MATNPIKGNITFIENHLSPLLAGEYMVRVDQLVQNTNTDAAPKMQINENYYNEKRFAVTAPRFIVPGTDVSNVFPPDNNQGEYDNVLPHIVLTAKALPWIRSADGVDGTPWLALLLFEESEMMDAAGRPLEPKGTTRTGDLQSAAYPSDAKGTKQLTSSLPTDTVSYPGFDASKPHMPVGSDGLDYGENWFTPCRFIDVPISLFAEIAPSKADMKLLIHARSLDTTAVKTVAGGKDDNDFSVVVCNRLPIPNTKCVVHLVSLENLASTEHGTDYLPTVDASGNYKPGTFKTGISYLRLASLKRWSFKSIDPKETFTQYLEQLDSGPLQIPVPNGEADVDVTGPLNLGFTPLNHHTRLGDQTVSWYRGPLVPIAAPAEFEPLPDPTTSPVAEPLMSADQAIRYNPGTGMLDVSYAAAWKIGQLLGVQNQHFATALYNWKRANTQKTVLSLERQVLRDKLGTVLQLNAEEHNTEGLHVAATALLAGPLNQFIQGACNSVDDANETEGETSNY
jgi:hypothetical protein